MPTIPIATTPEPAADAPAARLVGVSKRFGAVTALDRLDLDLRRGEVTAVLGPNGAGKTTAVRSFLGLCRIDAGGAELFGGDPLGRTQRMRTGAMMQISAVPPTLTVGEHLAMFSAYYPRPLPPDEVLLAAGLEGLERRPYGELSSGQQQRVLFALAICGDPELLFLDEPTVGLDVASRRRFWQHIRELASQERTVLLTTHYLEEADALADRIVVINRGRIVADGSTAEIKAQVASRRVRCRTRLAAGEVATMDGVEAVSEDGTTLEILTSTAESVVRQLLRRDPGLSELEISGADLEEAFLSLTAASPEHTLVERGACLMTPLRAVADPAQLPSPPSLLRIYLLEAKLEFLKVLRLPAFAIPTLTFPVLFYVFFGLSFDTGAPFSMATYLLATYGAFGVIGASLFGFGIGVAIERGQGWMLLKRASPMPLGAYFTGKLAMSLLFSTLIVAMLYLLGALFGGVELTVARWSTMALVHILGGLPFCAFGLAVGYFAGPNSAPAIVNVLYLPMAFLSGLWVPIQALPELIQRLAPALPAYHFAQLSLKISGLDAGHPVSHHVAYLAGFTIVCLALARLGYRRDEDQTYG